MADSERLFVPAKARQADEMAGVVRITVPDLPDEDQLFAELLRRLAPYPDLLIDWRKDAANLNTVEHQIDLGVRIGEPADNRFIIKKVGGVCEKIIAAPSWCSGWASRRIGRICSGVTPLPPWSMPPQGARKAGI